MLRLQFMFNLLLVLITPMVVRTVLGRPVLPTIWLWLNMLMVTPLSLLVGTICLCYEPLAIIMESRTGLRIFRHLLIRPLCTTVIMLISRPKLQSLLTVPCRVLVVPMPRLLLRTTAGEAWTRLTCLGTPIESNVLFIKLLLSGLPIGTIILVVMSVVSVPRVRRLLNPVTGMFLQALPGAARAVIRLLIVVTWLDMATLQLLCMSAVRPCLVVLARTGTMVLLRGRGLTTVA